MSAPQRPEICAIPYHHGLTAELAREHERLRELFGLVAQAFGAGRRELCIERLHEFDRALRLYLADEGVRFENYMRHLLSDDGENLRLMSRLRARLRGLSHYIHTLAQTEREGRLSGQGYRDFGTAMDRVAVGLKQVFECQQRLLFPLYRPTSANN